MRTNIRGGLVLSVLTAGLCLVLACMSTLRAGDSPTGAVPAQGSGGGGGGPASAMVIDQSTNESISSGGVFQTVTFDTNVSSFGTAISHSTSTNTDRISFNATGFAFITFSTRLNSGNTASLIIQKTSAGTTGWSSSNNGNVRNGASYIGITATLDVVSGDYIQISIMAAGADTMLGGGTTNTVCQVQFIPHA